MDQEFYRISELNNFIKDVINAGFPQVVWVCGEIQQYNRNKTKKHVFFELVEKDERSKDIIARIGLVIFENRKKVIENMLKKAENAFELKDDIEVKFACKVDFYSPHGTVRLIVENIDPIYTLGRLAQEKQKLIALLKEKGVLDKNKKLELPAVPLNIGLITSYDSAAYNDFLSELRKSRFYFNIYLRNSLMQGKKCPEDICKALDTLNDLKDLDLIIITRGGGSIADLSCFDNQLIAEKIASSGYPVLSGIGHEIDLTITDMAAHTFAKTPTAIAQFLTGRVQAFLDLLERSMVRLIDGSVGSIEKKKALLRDKAGLLQRSTNEFLKVHNVQLIRFFESLIYKPFLLMKNKKSDLLRLNGLLIKSSGKRLHDEKNLMGNYEKMITMVNPVNTMKRGFSVTRAASGRLLKGIEGLDKDEQIVTELIDGKVRSHIYEIKREGSNGGS